MRGLVLAAGRGSRLSAQTTDRPKALIEVGGRSLFDRQVAALRAAGATEVGVVAGWQAERFDAYAGRVFVNAGWDRGTMVGSLLTAAEWLAEETVVVGYGDIVYSAETVRALDRSGAPLAISYDPDWLALWRSRFTDPLADAETFSRDASGHLTEIGARATHLDEIKGQYMGLLRFTPAGWAEARRVIGEAPAGGVDMTGLLSRIVAAGRLPITTVPTAGPWFEFDQPSDLELGRKVIDWLDDEAAKDSR